MKYKSLLIAALISLGSATAFAAPSQQAICAANGIDYQQASHFVAEVQTMIKSDDKEKLAANMMYPLRINEITKQGKHHSFSLKDKQAFIAKYDSIFTSVMKTKLMSTDVFCNAQGASVGSGPIWFKSSQNGMKIFVINMTP